MVESNDVKVLVPDLELVARCLKAAVAFFTSNNLKRKKEKKENLKRLWYFSLLFFNSDFFLGDQWLQIFHRENENVTVNDVC